MSILAELFGHQPRQSVLHFKRRAAGRDAGAIGDPENVGVDRDGGLTEGRIQHHVGSFSSDTWERLKRLTIIGDFATMVFDQNRAGLDQVPGF